MITDVPAHNRGIVQIAYVTSDISLAQETLCRIYDIGHFLEIRDFTFDTREGMSAVIHLAIACLGPVQIEIIEPISGDIQFYLDFLPDPPSIVRFHHVNWQFENENSYFRKFNQLKEAGSAFSVMANFHDTHVFYCDLRDEIGHYIEAVAPVYGKSRVNWPIPQF